MLAGMCVGTVARAAPCVPSVHGVNLPAAWQRVSDALAQELAARTDVERCAGVTIHATPAGASVVVAVGDRRARRAVVEPADLRATVLALLLVPELPPAVAPTSAPDPAPASMAPTPIVDAAADSLAARVVHAESRPTSRPRSRFDLAVTMGLVWTDQTAHLAPGASVRWTSGGWLAGLEGRLDVGGAILHEAVAVPQAGQTTAPSAYELRSRAVGAEMGRQLTLGPAIVAATLGPRVIEFVQTSMLETTSRTVVQLGGQLRVGRATHRFGWFVAIDASFELGGPTIAMADAPALPTWCAGLALGAELRAWP